MTGAATDPRPGARPRRAGATLAAALLGGALGAGLLFGGSWYRYVTAGASPYEEVGIAINSRLPDGPRAWGCARIAERFPRTPPPYGCQRP